VDNSIKAGELIACVTTRCHQALRFVAFDAHSRDRLWLRSCNARVARDGSLEYLERYRIEPNDVTVLRPWAARDASYVGTALITGQPMGSGVAEQIHLALGHFVGVLAACDQLEPRALLVRLMSASGPAFHQARRWIDDHWKTLANTTPSPPKWIKESLIESRQRIISTRRGIGWPN
jgi:urease accessory protein UreH